ncbi:hypothetical protein [Polynucleobacter sp. Nonnen-W13]
MRRIFICGAESCRSLNAWRGGGCSKMCQHEASYLACLLIGSIQLKSKA